MEKDMSEEIKENDNSENGSSEKSDYTSHSVGGFFDSLIADFSLDSIEPINVSDDKYTDDKPMVETVDGITAEKFRAEFTTADTDPVVLFDSEEENGEKLSFSQPAENADDASPSAEEPASEEENEASDEAEEAAPEEEKASEDIIDSIINEAESDGAESTADNADSEKSEETDEEKHIPTTEEMLSDDFVHTVEDTKKPNFFRSLFPCSGDSTGEIIRKIVFLAAVIVFIVAGILLVRNLVDSNHAVEDAEEVKEFVTTTVGTTINEDGEVVTVTASEEEEMEHNFSVMEYYKSMNEDVVGFIELEGCDIYQPVVQGDDNEYYLTHTYYNGVNQAGAIFMDYRCQVTQNYVSPNIVLYGHNQQDRTMFGNLREYKYNLDFYAENPVVKFNTEYEVGEYVIFGYFVTNTMEKQDTNGEVFHYHDYIETLNNPATFNWYIYQIERRNQIISPVDVKFGDRLLVLSTCSNEYSDSRFVVFARKLRDGESIDDFDFTSAKLNETAKGIDWNAIMSVPTRATTAPAATVTTRPTTVTTVTTTVPTATEATTKRTKKTTQETTVTEPVTTTTVTTTTAPPETTTETTTPETTVTEPETEPPEETTEATTAASAGGHTYDTNGGVVLTTRKH